MTETPSGNRWEPAEDSTRPLAAPSPTPSPAPSPAPSPTPAPVGGPVAPPEYGWAPAPQAVEAGPPRRGRRRSGVLAAGAAVLVVGAAAGGYALGSASAGSDRPDFGTTRQAPPDGFAPGQGFPDRDDPGSDHDQFDGPDDGNS